MLALANAEQKFDELLETEIARIHDFLETKLGKAVARAVAPAGRPEAPRRAWRSLCARAARARGRSCPYWRSCAPVCIARVRQHTQARAPARARPCLY